MGKTTFSGPVRTGQDNGQAANTVGTLIACQEATVASNTSGGSSIVIPKNAAPTDIELVVETAASASGGEGPEIIFRFGNADDVDYFGSIGASAAGIYKIADYAVSAKSFVDAPASAMRVYIDATTAATAGIELSKFDGLARVYYIQRS